MISVVVLALLTQWAPGPHNRHTRENRRLGERSLVGQSYAFFEFAPTSGAGMGTACSCSAVTGAKGEPLTLTRASSATCVKGNPVTGIQNGDLVTCAADQPRVGNPDGLGLALLVEKTSQNVALHSQELENAYWAPLALGVAAPTVTANFAVGPFGGTTAERLQVPATGVGQYSILLSTSGVLGQVNTGSVYVKGNGTSGVFVVGLNGGPAMCKQCAFNPTTWTRCEVTTSLPSFPNFYFGNISTTDTGCPASTSAIDVLVSDAQLELGTYATSPIPTTNAAVTRAAEVPTATIPGGIGPTMCMAATVLFEGVSTDYRVALSVSGAAGNAYPSMTMGKGSSATAALFEVVHATLGAEETAPAVGTILPWTPYRIVASAIPSAGYWNGTSVATPARNMNGAANVITLGRYVTSTGFGGSGAPLDGYVRGVMLDPSPTRCGP